MTENELNSLERIVSAYLNYHGDFVVPREVTKIPEAAQQVPTERRLIQLRPTAVSAPCVRNSSKVWPHKSALSYQNLMRNSTKRKVDLILVHSLSRFGQSTLEANSRIVNRGLI